MGIRGAAWVLLASMLAAPPSSKLTAARTAPEIAYRVIVHPKNPATAIDRKSLATIFLKKTTDWPDGQAVRPVDLRVDSRARERFSEDILGKSIITVKSYWQQQIFSGRDVPPPELESDEAVVRYVQHHQGAIGYVSGAADVRGAKVIDVH